VQTFTFAMGPVHLDEDGEELRERLARRLEERLGQRVRVEAHRSYAEVAAEVEAGRAQLAWLAPAVFVRLEQRCPVSLLAAVERDHGAEYRGVLFVPAASEVRTAKDLRGKRMAWVDVDSCAGHLFPLLALRAEGLEPSALFASEQFLGSHGSVVHAVLGGEADAGATFAQVAPGSGEPSLAGWYPYAGAHGMRPVLVSRTIPADVIVASGRLDADALDEVREAVLTLHESGGDELLDELFGGRRLVAAHTADYDPVRAALV
jgi:phosphonate transport system substrate-binding protein